MPTPVRARPSSRPRINRDDPTGSYPEWPGRKHVRGAAARPEAVSERTTSAVSRALVLEALEEAADPPAWLAIAEQAAVLERFPPSAEVV